MNSWSLRWRILLETIVLVAITGTVAVIAGWIGAVLIGLLAAVIARYRARALSQLFSEMTEGVLRTGSIDRRHRIEPQGPAELARMARAVNRLADRLVSHTDAEVAERTRLSSILESMIEGVAVVDESGAVEFVNPAALSIFATDHQFEPGDLLVSLTNNYEINETSGVTAASGEPRQVEVELYDPRRLVQVQASPLPAAADGRGRALLLITDLTELRQVDVTRREFVSNASHELRTPIAAIKAAVETLQGGAAADEEARSDFLRRIAEDVDRLEELVNEMLELSRLESGQTPMHMAPTEPSSLVRSVADRFSPIAREAGVTIAVEASEPLPDLTADAVKLERVLANLVRNALDATREGGSIALGAIEDGGSIAFQVTDSGTGISEEHMPHIFERFYKADAARTTGGTGLGLAISRHIVQAHHGEITADSTPGQGATFTVRIPVSARE